MKITHTTLLSNLASIRKYGLLVTFARQGRKAVWLHVKRLDQWAENHVHTRHDADRDTIVHLDFEVPEAWVRRHANGVYWCPMDIPPERIRGIRVVRRVVEHIPL